MIKTPMAYLSRRGFAYTAQLIRSPPYAFSLFPYGFLCYNKS